MEHLVKPQVLLHNAQIPQLLLPGELREHLIPRRRGRPRPVIPALPEELRQLLKEFERAPPGVLKIPQRVDKLPRIIIVLEDIRDPSELTQLRPGKPLRREHLVGRPHGIADVPLFCPPVHFRPREDLQKPKLQLVRVQRIYVVKRLPEPLIALEGEPRDEVHVEVDIFRAAQPLNISEQARQVRHPPYRRERLRIRRLDPDLQLHESRPKPLEKRKLLLRKQIRPYLKMKIRHPVIVIPEVCPDCHRPLMARVEGPVDEFHLRHPPVDEELQLREHLVKAPKPHLPVDRA